MKLIYLLQDLLPLYFFFNHLFITSILSNNAFCFFMLWEQRDHMWKYLKNSIYFYFLLCYNKWNNPLWEIIWKGWKYFSLIRCWLIFFYLINKGFCRVGEFVFCNKLDRIRRQNFGAKVVFNVQRFPNQFWYNCYRSICFSFYVPSLRHSMIFLLFDRDE